MAGTTKQQQRSAPALALLLCALLASKLAFAAEVTSGAGAADKPALVTLSSLPVLATAHARVLQQGGPDLLSPPAPATLEESSEDSAGEESSGEMSNEESSNEESSGEESSSDDVSNNNTRGNGAARKLLMRGL